MPSSGIDSPAASWTLPLWHKACRRSGVRPGAYPSREGDQTFTRWELFLSDDLWLSTSSLTETWAGVLRVLSHSLLLFCDFTRKPITRCYRVLWPRHSQSGTDQLGVRFSLALAISGPTGFPEVVRQLRTRVSCKQRLLSCCQGADRSRSRVLRRQKAFACVR